MLQRQLGTPGPCRKVCECIYSHLDVRDLADSRAGAAVLLLAAGSGAKAIGFSTKAGKLSRAVGTRLVGVVMAVDAAECAQGQV